jgi:hypothetical protein
MPKINVEELIFMIGELYVENQKTKQINVTLAREVDRLTKEKQEGEKKDAGDTGTDNDKRGASD